MTESLHPTSDVLSHDFYRGPTEPQMQMIQRLNELQREYAALIVENPLFKSAVRTWVEEEHDGVEVIDVLNQFKIELDQETEGMSKQERADNPDADLHEMVKLRLEIATLKLNIAASEHVTSVDLSRYKVA